jgi:hypothetical protein
VRVPGVREVEVRAYTGSLLFLYDPAALDPETLAARLRELSGAERVLAAGEAARDESGSVAREMVRLWPRWGSSRRARSGGRAGAHHGSALAQPGLVG